MKPVLLLLFLVGTVSLIDGRCNYSGHHMTKHCFPTDHPYAHFSMKQRKSLVPIIGGADKEHVQIWCKDDKYIEIFDCVGKNLEECFSFIKGAIINLKNVWFRFCKHVDVYLAHIGCYQSQRDALRQCIERSLNMTVAPAYGSMGKVEFEKFLCREKEYENRCQDHVLRSRCGNEAADIIKEYNDAIQLHPCNQILNRATTLDYVAMWCCFPFIVSYLVASYDLD